MSDGEVFSGRALLALGGLTIAALVGVLFFAVRGSGAPGIGDAVGPSTFSRSAIGHAGFARLLEGRGITVVTSRYDSLEKLGAGGLLVVAEPGLGVAADEPVRRLLEAPRVLLVLPKRGGDPSLEHPGWIGSTELLPAERAERVLHLASDKATVVRAAGAQSWSKTTLAGAPAPLSPVQLIEGGGVVPIVRGPDGILVGEIRRGPRRLWILSDPDVIANHGLSRDGNAAFALATVEALRGQGGPVVFDELVHGYLPDAADPVSLLFQPPFVFVTVQAVLALLFLMWGAGGRFGAPETPPVPLAAGRQGLLRNAAGLLEYAGHQQVIVERYVQATIRYVAGQIRAPRGLAGDALTGWLQRVGNARGVAVDCAEVARRARELLTQRRPDHRGLERAAHDIHRWKREIIDGPAEHSRRH